MNDKITNSSYVFIICHEDIIIFFFICNSLNFLIHKILIPPTITHISIDSISQQVQLYWYNNAPQAIGYVVYFQDASGLWIPLDTEWERKIYRI